MATAAEAPCVMLAVFLLRRKDCGCMRFIVAREHCVLLLVSSRTHVIDVGQVVKLDEKYKKMMQHCVVMSHNKSICCA